MRRANASPSPPCRVPRRSRGHSRPPLARLLHGDRHDGSGLGQLG
ncbi:hypothetical protein ACFPRL_21925 [Pseudoclavibacter helvolus]